MAAAGIGPAGFDHFVRHQGEIGLPGQRLGRGHHVDGYDDDVRPVIGGTDFEDPEPACNAEQRPFPRLVRSDVEDALPRELIAARSAQRVGPDARAGERSGAFDTSLTANPQRLHGPVPLRRRRFQRREG